MGVQHCWLGGRPIIPKPAGVLESVYLESEVSLTIAQYAWGLFCSGFGVHLLADILVGCGGEGGGVNRLPKEGGADGARLAAGH